MLSGSAQAAPSAGDFEPRRTIHTYPSVINATHQAEVATGADGTTVTAFLVGWTGYVSVRAPGAVAWSRPVQLTTGTVHDPEISIGDDGTIAVAWARAGAGVQVAVRSAGAVAWEKAVNLNGTQHTVAVAANGVVTVVSSAFRAASRKYQVQSWRRPAGSGKAFAGPTVISDGVGHERTPRLLVDRSGRPTLVWSRERDNGDHDQVRLAVGSATANTWPIQQVVAQTDPTWIDVRIPDLTLGSDGSVTIAYARKGSGGNYRVDARTRSAADVWAGNVVLRTAAATRPTQIQAVTTGNGTTLVAWSDRGTMRARHRLPGSTSWSAAPVDLGGSGTLPPQLENGTIHLAGGPGASAVATWVNHAHQSNGEIRVRQFEGGSWSSAYVLSETIANTSWHSWGPAVAVGPGGRQTVIWGRQHLPDGNSGKPTLSERSTPVPPVTLRGAARILGTPRVGETLTCDARFANAASVAYTWRRGSATVGRARGYRAAAADLGKRLTCTAVGSNQHGAVPTSSPATAPMARGVKLRAAKRPGIKGKKRPGRTLKVKGVRWTPAADRLTYRWFRNGKKIKGKKGAKRKYVVRRADRGTRLHVKITAKRAGHANGTIASRKVRIRR